MAAQSESFDQNWSRRFRCHCGAGSMTWQGFEHGGHWQCSNSDCGAVLYHHFLTGRLESPVRTRQVELTVAEARALAGPDCETVALSLRRAGPVPWPKE